MKSFFDHYASDSTYLFFKLKELGYDEAFITECRRFVRVEFGKLDNVESGQLDIGVSSTDVVIP